MPEQTPSQRASAELAAAAFRNPALRAKFELMIKEMATRDPVRDDFSWLDPAVQNAAERVSLHPVDPEDALRALLATPPIEERRYKG